MKIVGALLCGAAGLLATNAAQAATFTFSFEAPVMQFGEAGDVYAGSGQIETDDTLSSGSTLVVRSVSGSVGLRDYPEYSYDVVGGSGTVLDLMNGMFGIGTLQTQLSGGPGIITITPNGTGGYEFAIGEVGAPNGAVTITPLVSAVPEPAGWAMMMVGLAGVGAGLRVRRRIAIVYS